MADFKEKEEEYTPYAHDSTLVPEQQFSPTPMPGANMIPPRFRDSTIDFELPYFLGLFVGQSISSATPTVISPTVLRTNMTVSPFEASTSSVIIPSDGIYEINYNVSPATPVAVKASEHYITINGSTNIAYFESNFTQTNGQTSSGTYIGNFSYNDKITLTYSQNSGGSESVYGFLSLKKVA